MKIISIKIRLLLISQPNFSINRIKKYQFMKILRKIIKSLIFNNK